MNLERLNQIEEVYHALRETPAGGREAVLDQLCGADAELRREVESLLAFERMPDNILDAPPEALAAEMFSQEETRANLTGTAISHYKIINLLGAGGMGEVYLAEDTRLRRRVALKILPQTLADAADRLRRFEQEAFAASALNHPNILTIFEFGEEGETHFLAAEYVQGETLRARLQRERLTLPETLDLAVQIASALHDAHQAGIVHHDIKPENLMVRPDGIVKVLDFGLAKLAEASAAPAAMRALATAGVSTRAGVIMGTTGYMSPEQARGLETDARTDIWSLGVVLYELVCGHAPFEGPSASDVMAAILTQAPPPLSHSAPDAPAELERIIKKALEKDRGKRYQAAKDLMLDLKRLGQRLEFEVALVRTGLSGEQVATAAASPVVTARPLSAHTAGQVPAYATGGAEQTAGVARLHRRRTLPALAALLLTSAGAAFWLYTSAGRRPAAPPPPAAKIIPFTTFPGATDHPAFSPDGKQIAFTWGGGGDGKNLDLYVKLIGAGGPLRLTTDPAEEVSPAWSPDGRYLAFIRRTEGENGIFIVPALGGAERKLGRAEPTYSGLRWSPDGRFLAVPDRASPQERYGIFLLSVEDGEKRRLTSPPESSADIAPAFSPDGQTLAFIRNTDFSSDDIYLTPARGGEPRRLTTDGQRINSLAWTADGRELVFSSNRGGGFSLWRVAVTGGAPERVASTGQNSYSPAISRQGDRLAYNVSFIDSDIWRVAGPGDAGRRSAPTKLISSTRQDHSPQYSPDGTHIVFASDRSGSDELWVCESDGSNPAQVTFFNDTVVGSPRWSPDSRQLVFDARPNGNADIYVMSAEGGRPRPLTAEPSHDVMASWSRDGRWVYFCSSRSGTRQIWKVPADGGQAVQVTQQGGFEAFESPDGTQLYYTKGRGPGGIWQAPVAGGEERQVPELLGAGYWRYWAVLADGIYFVSPAAAARPALKFYSFATRRVTQLGALERDPLQGPPGLTVSPDGRSILYAQTDQSISDIMLVENFR